MSQTHGKGVGKICIHHKILLAIHFQIRCTFCSLYRCLITWKWFEFGAMVDDVLEILVPPYIQWFYLLTSEVRVCRTSGNESSYPLTQWMLQMNVESANQLVASEMLCNEGRQDFDLIAAGFIGVVLVLCLSCLIAWNFLAWV